jgi:hypothetical protein
MISSYKVYNLKKKVIGIFYIFENSRLWEKSIAHDILLLKRLLKKELEVYPILQAPFLDLFHQLLLIKEIFNRKSGNP